MTAVDNNFTNGFSFFIETRVRYVYDFLNISRSVV